MVDQYVGLYFYSASSLSHQTTCSSSRTHYPNQFLFFLLSDVSFIVFDLIRSQIKFIIYHTQGEHCNFYTIDAVIY
jgi:hypothetical protein